MCPQASVVTNNHVLVSTPLTVLRPRNRRVRLGADLLGFRVRVSLQPGWDTDWDQRTPMSSPGWGEDSCTPMPETAQSSHPPHLPLGRPSLRGRGKPGAAGVMQTHFCLTACLSLLLHHKLPQPSADNIFPHSLCGPGVQEQLRWLLLAQRLS